MHIASLILNWYKTNKRELPWRINPNPYHVWVSEIIMQQTKMEQGLPLVHQFLKWFKVVATLAEASENEVLLAWQGLRYYSRARNIHFTAKHITSDLNGYFPEKYNKL